VQRLARLGGRVAGHHGLHRHRFHHQRLALHQEGKALPVGGFEAGGDAGEQFRGGCDPTAQATTTSAESLPS
jgi:hypothetical protein